MISLAAVHEGFSSKPKALNHAFLYDGLSYEFFEAVCAEKDYYLYHGDMENMHTCAKEVAKEVGKNALLVEFGCGSCDKSVPFLDTMEELSAFVASDIDERVVKDVKGKMGKKYPKLNIVPHHGDVFKTITLPAEGERKVGILASGMVGAFPESDVTNMLDNCLQSLGDNGILLASFDANQDPKTTIQAYTTATYAKFVKNAFHAVNNRFGTNIDLNAFEHCVDWNEEEKAVEHTLQAKSCQDVEIDGNRYVFEQDEKVMIFEARKLSTDTVETFVKNANGVVKRTFFDKEKFMCVFWIEKA